ncbi:MAG: methylmalonyl-CoA carboxyltransferase, partial [Firmicutes bacterium]|nr:methylmalonyl-CoA carboxyltransferase [Bacillota bacterium]
MSRIDKVNELIAKRSEEHSTERQRLDRLFDTNSFVEIGSLTHDAGVVTGYGTINGELVYAFSQEGAVNVAHAAKISNIYSLAVKMGSPIIGILDSKGVVMEEGLDVLEAFGIILKSQAEASGVIPQISIIAGDCRGMGSFIPVLADFVIMTKANSTMFMQSPSVVEGIDGRSVSH